MKLVFATHNANKLREVQALMPEGVQLLSLDDIDCHEDIPETADTIEGNAILKAQYVKEHYGLDCFADDTGLEVTALNGAPGVYSARYAGPENDAQANIQKLLDALQEAPDRSARFKTVMALAMGEQMLLFPGICEGEITSTQAGEQGFGYDPIFLPNGYSQTFAQMDQREKGAISHRGRALALLVEHLNGISS